MAHLFYSFAAGSLWLLGVIFLMNVTDVNKVANRWLAAFYLCSACIFTQLYLEKNPAQPNALLLHFLELPRWSILPCFYFAVLNYVNPFKKYNYLHLLHFLPFVCFSTFSLVYILPNIDSNNGKLPEFPGYIRFSVRYFFTIQIIIYAALCLRQLRKHATNIQLITSITDKIDLEWIKHLLWLIIALFILRMMSIFYIMPPVVVPIFYYLGILFLSYCTLRQKVIYAVEKSQSKEIENIIEKKPANERLSIDQLEIFKTKVLNKTINEQLFLESGLTLPMLSDRVGIGIHELSYIINTGFNKNFYQFINEMRIEKAKELLLSEESKNADTLSIATWAGFNSKTTFFSTFKKMTGQTPKEYKKSHTL